jgi:hypothetical protein
MGYELFGTPAGKGRLDIPYLVNKVKTIHPQTNVILELWPPFEESVSATILKEYRWSVESMEYLRKVLGQE